MPDGNDDHGDDNGDDIAREVLAQFAKLPKRGKPALRPNGRREWTVIAGIVATAPASAPGAAPVAKCVAIGTGLKCLPESARTNDGASVNDSHAEAVCRRSLRRFLLAQMLLVLACKNSWVLQRNDGAGSNPATPFVLRPGVKLSMYISQSPCGDASMRALDKATSHKLAELAPLRVSETSGDAPATGDHGAPAADGATLKRKHSDAVTTDTADGDNQQRPAKQAATSDRAATTTASAVHASLAASSVIRGRNDFTATSGRLRTKPGRPDAPPTTSMSCSDKLAKWNAIGLGGALLSMLLPPLHLESLAVGHLFDAEALHGSLVMRVGCTIPIEIRHATVTFEWSQPDLAAGGDAGADPAAAPLSADAALAWCLGEESEAIVAGRKQGSSPKAGVWPEKSRVRICTLETARLFAQVVKQLDVPYREAILGTTTEPVTYRALKLRATTYQEAKARLYGGPLKGWIVHEQPDFTLDL
ncbi:hypothetical protein HK105_206719 [Polyrhizophydium stewartii]|uniref:tRNA-specific adenosine deaminase 1 n=1 Tax=Polyrhizophydium stewartii TaxID=2732419 RepID=A0ABR4N2E1_9FUNG|nr:hypothetical protein HK105_005045 [Polyrhizophydium stewartii]